jgi:hypothetical protein
MSHPSGRPAVHAVAHDEKMAVQGRKRAALFSCKGSAQLYLDEILRLRLAVSELPAPDQPRQGSPHREAYGER